MKKIPRPIIKLIYIIAVGFLVYIFAVHGFRALVWPQEFAGLALAVGVDGPGGLILLRMLGILDIAVAALLLVAPRHRWVWTYAALWPMVPAAIKYTQGIESLGGAIAGVAVTLVAAMIGWQIARKKK